MSKLIEVALLLASIGLVILAKGNPGLMTPALIGALTLLFVIDIYQIWQLFKWQPEGWHQMAMEQMFYLLLWFLILIYRLCSI